MAKRLYASRLRASRIKATAVFAGTGSAAGANYYLKPNKGTWVRLTKLPDPLDVS